ncbi:penicillin-binding protein 2 [Taibaiella sp. KBW10]|uniref:penicillin-binding protein 2 n=1 Tax=Taibaiella sp. KBW10 TaxID=2153357 RepID=UPI000F5934E9|nr:penicillin-binding protein 2 [Taibaiella sp. KBW10]RQO31793.1 penicillin-binding protein 2 [Taibaiella sp. KBW10]
MINFNNNPRAWIVRLLFAAMAVALIFRLFNLQVWDDKYKVLADDQAIFRKVIYPARGSIVDRNGKAMLYNNVTFDLVVTPSRVTKDMDTAAFCSILGITEQDFEKELNKVLFKNGKQKPGVYKAQISKELNARLQENMYLFPGFELAERSMRSYPESSGALLLGYLSEVSPAMLENPRFASYRQGDYVGMSGLENVYEEELRGTRGVQYLVRDVMNRPRDAYKDGAMDTVASGGKELQLYIDAELQAYGEKLMSGKIGSAVAIDPQTGGILAMVSAPSFDPNLLTGEDKGRHFADLNKMATKPLFNYATQAFYPPGSTFKPITGLVGLDVGAITPSFGYPCAGGYYACGKRIGCTHSGHGHAANLKVALANSCNAYFCDVFRKIVDMPKFGGVHKGLETWYEYMNHFGFGHPLGVDITSEGGGLIPDSSFYNNMYRGGSWNSCNMAIVGMGQGEVTVSPMQLANSMCMIANKGFFYTPHLVKSIGGDAKHPKLKKYLEKHQTTNISATDYQAVIDGMEMVVTNGTGRVAQLPGIAVSAKTGTVENYALLFGKKTKLDNHSVFVCFAPKDNPRIAIAVVVQNAGYGATWAGPVASLMMEKYLTDSVKRKPLEEKMFHANLVKKYTYTIDSLQRIKDKLRWEMKMADKEGQIAMTKRGDTLLVNTMLEKFYHLKK